MWFNAWTKGATVLENFCTCVYIEYGIVLLSCSQSIMIAPWCLAAALPRPLLIILKMVSVLLYYIDVRSSDPVSGKFGFY